MSTHGKESSDGIYKQVKEEEQPSEEVSVSVSFRIIRQFSLQLYDNPRRAIEELVCNSYDANATECHISTPSSGEDSLYVLDNGHSMDVDGLEWLWKVAASRKEKEFGEDREKNGRQQIGKFGVGKLASFALGNRLTYVATKGGTTRVISVHQNDLKDENGGSEDFAVYEFPETEAKDKLRRYFETIPEPWEKDWENWTLAIINDIPPEKTGNDLEPWHLKNMISTAIPTRTNFDAYLNEDEIEERDPHGELEINVDITEDPMVDRIEESIKSYWASQKEIDRSEVDKSLYETKVTTFEDPQNTDEQIAGLEIPKLGNVSGTGELYDRRLTTDKRKERGFEDNGFRVFVRGKLLNKNDPLFGLDALSFTYWVKFIGVFEMPGLDDQIRVQRDQVKDSVSVDIARRVLRQTFQEVRSQARSSSEEESADDGGNKESDPLPVQKSFSQRLQDRSRQYAYDAVRGLTREESDDDIELEGIDLITRPLNPSDRAVEYHQDDNLVVINEEHPLFDTLRRQNDFTENIEDGFKEILAARLLIHGYLRQNGAGELALAASRQIFDSVLRSAAGNLGADELDYQLTELEDASTVGGTRFENAIVDIFQNIGLSAVQEGGPDTHDAVIEVPTIGENHRISVEAKGSKGVVSHDQLSFDDVNRHRKEQNCQTAITIAREFQLEGIGNGKSALLRNLDSEINEEAVENISLFTTDALEVFLRLHNKKPFTYSETIDVLTNEKTPGEISDYVIDVWEGKPTDELTRNIIQVAHDFMEENPTNPPSIGALTYNKKLREVEREKIEERVESLSTLTSSVELLSGEEFRIDAPVDTILQEVDDIEINSKSVLESGNKQPVDEKDPEENSD